MALVIPAGFAQASLQMRNSGDPDPWYITFGVELTDLNFVAEREAARIESAARDNLANVISSDTRMTGVQLRIGVSEADPFTVFHPFDIQGLSTSETLPQNNAVLVTKQTERSGRTGKGRLYVPCVNEGAVSNVGVLTETFRNLMQDRMTGFLEDLAAPETTEEAPATMVLLHSAGAPGGSAPNVVTSLIVAPVIATQRRRLR